MNPNPDSLKDSQPSLNRPHTTVILAMSADGKIADKGRSPARFGSAVDKAHLEKQIARMDGVLFGRGTLDAYGSTLRVTSAELLRQRQQENRPAQPIQILCSQSGQINFDCQFFQQPIPRWWLTTPQGLATPAMPMVKLQTYFEQILTVKPFGQGINWLEALGRLLELGLERLAVLGGGQLVSSLAEQGLIDELWLTVCPVILGGVEAPTPVEGEGFLAHVAPRLKLLEVRQVDQEVFLHYQVL
ncbi:MAG: RibD family protein [Microcoleaceae cyanobacterium]